MPDPLFQKLFSDTQRLRPAPVEQVQARGRQRTRRQQLSIAGAALVLLIPVGVVFALRQENRQPTVVATASPELTANPAPPEPSPRSTTGPATTTSPASSRSTSSGPVTEKLTSVPVAALLRAEDLGGSGWTTSDDDIGGDWGLAPTIGSCTAARKLASFGDPAHKRWRSIGRRSAATGVVQEVLLLPGGGAQKYLTYYRQGAVLCATTVVYDTKVTVTIVAQGFAGSGSVLIRTSAQHDDRLYGIVVHGDLASQFAVNDGSEATGRKLGARVRTLLCQATKTC